MLLFKDILIKYFPSYFKQEDTYKDNFDKGLFQRFTEALGEELDLEIVVSIQYLLDVFDPVTVDERLITYLARQKGLNFAVIEDLATQRKVIRYAIKANKLRGTGRGYEFLLGLLGYEVVTITEVTPDESIYDTTDIYDNGHLFDTSCPVCSDYTLELENSTILGRIPTSSEYKSLLNAIAYMQPVIAELVLPINLNTVDITEVTVIVSYDVDGNVTTYHNEFDPELTITQVGPTLTAHGPYAGDYVQAGTDLTFTLP